MFMYTPNEIEMYKTDVLKAIEKRQLAAPTLLYTNPNDLTNINKQSIRGGYTTESVYARNMSNISNEMNKLLKELDRDIDDKKLRAKHFKNLSNGAKYEVELYNIISSNIKSKLDILKAKADIQTKIDNSRKADYKLSLDSGMINTGPAGNTSSSANSFIQSIMDDPNMMSSNQLVYNPMGVSANSPLINEYKDTDTRMNILPPKEVIRKEVIESQTEIQDNTTNNSSLGGIPTPNEVNEALSKEVYEIPAQEETYIVNALGEKVKLYNEEGLDEFIPDSSNDIDYNRALNVIEAKDNPHMKIFFKYNRETDDGYLVYIDESTGEEHHELTTLPLEYVYPWSIDFNNNIVTTYSRYDYPILYTNDEIPEDKKVELKLVKDRVNGVEDIPEEITE